jgi:O-acetyl-ADP-ribose deacetylase (regulator of RNase III)
MERSFDLGACRLDLWVGDITTQTTDAIVSAANALLMGGGGVDGAIHRAAGPELLEACRQLKKGLPGGVLKTGGAVVTPGFRLAAKHVIHCVGPIYDREGPTESRILLERCYREALAIARREAIGSITFPSISTGVYGYPVERAAPIALSTIVDELRRHGAPGLVRMSLFDARTFEVYAAAADGLLSGAIAVEPSEGREDEP